MFRRLCSRNREILHEPLIEKTPRTGVRTGSEGRNPITKVLMIISNDQQFSQVPIASDKC